MSNCIWGSDGPDWLPSEWDRRLVLDLFFDRATELDLEQNPPADVYERCWAHIRQWVEKKTPTTEQEVDDLSEGR